MLTGMLPGEGGLQEAVRAENGEVLWLRMEPVPKFIQQLLSATSARLFHGWLFACSLLLSLAG